MVTTVRGTVDSRNESYDKTRKASDDDTISKMLENHQSTTFHQPRSHMEKLEHELQKLYEENPLGFAREMPRQKLVLKVNGRFKKTLGRCSYNKPRSGEYLIEVSKAAMKHGEEWQWKDTLRHEVAHAYAFELHGESQRHNDEWKRICEAFGAIPEKCSKSRVVPYKYVVYCPDCGNEWGRHRKCKLIKKHEYYNCGECDTTLERKR